MRHKLDEAEAGKQEADWLNHKSQKADNNNLESMPEQDLAKTQWEFGIFIGAKVITNSY